MADGAALEFMADSSASCFPGVPRSGAGARLLLVTAGLGSAFRTSQYDVRVCVHTAGVTRHLLKCPPSPQPSLEGEGPQHAASPPLDPSENEAGEEQPLPLSRLF